MCVCVLITATSAYCVVKCDRLPYSVACLDLPLPLSLCLCPSLYMLLALVCRRATLFIVFMLFLLLCLLFLLHGNISVINTNSRAPSGQLTVRFQHSLFLSLSLFLSTSLSYCGINVIIHLQTAACPHKNTNTNTEHTLTHTQLNIYMYKYTHSFTHKSNYRRSHNKLTQWLTLLMTRSFSLTLTLTSHLILCLSRPFIESRF